MSIVINAKGTSVPYFTVGKHGVTLYQGTADPVGSYTIITGDYWFDATTLSLKIRSAGAVWVAPNIAGGAAGGIPYQTGISTTTLLAAGTSSQVLVSGATPSWTNTPTLTGTNFSGTAASLSIGGTAALAMNMAGGTANQISVQTGAGVTTFITAPTVASTFLEWTGSAFTWASAGAGGTGSPGGSTTQIQYNNTGVFAGSANLTFDGTSTLIVGGASPININGATGALTTTGTITGTGIIATENITGALSAGAFSYGTLAYTDVNIFESLTTGVNSYSQTILQNTTSAAASSVDFIISNNLGTASTYYGDLGITSSTYNTPGQNIRNVANTVYLQSQSCDLAIGTLTSNAIHFIVNTGATDAFTIGTAGQWGIAGSNGTTGQVFTSGGASAAPSWTTVSGGGGGPTVANDVSTNATYYPTFSTVTSGTLSTITVSNTALTFNPSSGTLSATAFNSLSDARAKANIRELGYGLMDVLKMTGHKYEMIDGGQTSIGLIAQEMQAIIPEVVSTNVEGMLGINYPVLTAVLIEAIKELTARIAILESK